MTTSTTLDGRFPPHVLRDYAMIADGFRGALVGPRGDISWLCVPTWDSAAVLAGLIGARGVYAVTPTERFVWGGHYEPGTLIWRSRWVSTDSTIESREALALPADPHTAVLLRRIVAHDQPVRVDVHLDLRADFGSIDSSLEREDGRWLLKSGTIRARWSGAPEARRHRDGSLRLTVDVPAGSHHDLVLEISDRSLSDPVDPDRAWEATESAWRTSVPSFSDSAAPRDSRHSYAVLAGLTAPEGGMVAAATLGLPERAQAGRNYDYRYVWLRDQAYAGLAAGVTEPLPLLDRAVAFTTARLLEHGDRIAPAYRLDGRLPPKETTLDLPGYPGGRNVVGNWVRGQFQLDGLGEMLQLYATAAGHDHLGAQDHQAVRLVVDLIARRWERPDAGVWELEDDWWTQSRLSCVAGLRRIAGTLRETDTAHAVTLADAILAETSRRCLAPNGAWLQRPGHAGTDTALLLPPVRGALPDGDPRTAATLRMVCEELVQDGYVYRYAVDGAPLGDAEGAFLMCGFAMSLAQLQAGHTVEAFRWFERQRAACGPPGLFAEEFDVRQRQLRGNLPQGFVHALLLECSQRLGGLHAGEAAS